MSVDYTRTTGGDTPDETESSAFAPAPIWDRKKGKGSGRAFFEQAAAADTTPMTSPIGDTAKPMRRSATAATAGVATGAMMGDEAVRETAMSPTGEDAAYVTTDRTVVVPRRSVAPVAVGAGLVALAALATAGWYSTRPADQTITPGAQTTSSTTIATTTAPTSPAPMAANIPTADNAAAAATPLATTTTTTHHAETATTRTSAPVVHSSRSTTLAVAHERPMRMRSASSSGVNTGATVSSNSVGAAPSAPSTPTPPPVTAAPPVNTMPAPAPAPATSAPDTTSPPASSAPTPTSPQ